MFQAVRAPTGIGSATTAIHLLSWLISLMIFGMPLAVFEKKTYTEMREKKKCSYIKA
ncbi:hypothetical protein DPMN_016249, partial [Dreissena polymorpha]